VRAFAAPTQSSAGGGPGLSEMLEDDRVPGPQEAVLNAVETELIQKLVDQLDDREATILRLRYGLGEEEPMTLKNIGAKIGLTRERVRQIEGEALQKLQGALSDDS
jgi:RNA polymerase primary sigma factor